MKELQSTKFVARLRKKFSVLFTDMLKTQLVLKGVIADEEWKDMKEHIQYDFLQDNNFTELKNAELMRERLEMLGQVESYVGTYFSKEWVKKNVLKFTDEEIESMETEIDQEGGGEDDNDLMDHKLGEDNESRKNK